jgi:hypothetical protein
VITGSIYEYKLRSVKENHFLYQSRWKCSSLMRSHRFETHIQRSSVLVESYIERQRINHNGMYFMPPLPSAVGSALYSNTLITCTMAEIGNNFFTFGSKEEVGDDYLGRDAPDDDSDCIAAEIIIELFFNSSDTDSDMLEIERMENPLPLTHSKGADYNQLSLS